MPAGRRDYDRQIDPVVENYVEERLRETRHALRQDIQVLAQAQALSTLKATEEHGQVRGEIQGVRNDLAALRRDLADVLPLRDAVADLKHRDEVDEVREQTAKQLLDEVRRQRTQTRNFMVGLSGLIVTAAGVIVALAH